MDKICVLTGGCGGMGHAISLRLGKDHTMLLADVSQERLDAEVAALAFLGIKAEGMVVDVTDKGNVVALASRATEMGVVDTVINTAGLSPAGSTAEAVLHVNAEGTVNMVETFYPVIAEGGVMIVFASTAAYMLDPTPEMKAAFSHYLEPSFYDELHSFVGDKKEDSNDFVEFFRGGTAYQVSKRFVLEYARANTCRFAKRGVRILSFSPGCHLTPMHQLLIDNQPEAAAFQMDFIPAGRWGRPVEVAGIIEFLCSPLAGFIAGVDILADGGNIAALNYDQIGEE